MNLDLFGRIVDGLQAAGLVECRGAVRFVRVDWGDGVVSSSGRAARYWPTAALLAMAAEHGITPATIKADFIGATNEAAPVVRDAIRVRSRKQGRQGSRLALPLSALGAAADDIKADVEAHNTFAAGHDIEGCLPPRWYRAFTACALLDGRWYAKGRDGYQGMAEADRMRLVHIAGEAVAEVDAKASHLSILLGLLGLPLPEGDPYAFPDLPRQVVKEWIVSALGSGRARWRWAPAAGGRVPGLAAFKPRVVGRIICARYPFMQAPAEAALRAAQLDLLGHVGPPERLLSSRLQAIEAVALTHALRSLRDAHGVLALPMHDGLLAPRSAVPAATVALVEGFASVGARIRTDVTTAE